MGPLISFLTLMVFLFVGLAQTHSLPPKLGYGIAIPLGVVTIVLAIVRYKQRKDRGE
jgi:hypothetical protein